MFKIGSERVHLIGVGGAGMSALARLIQGIGGDLTGSDRGTSPLMEDLRAEGLHLWVGHRPEQVHGENGYVVRSAAVPDDDPELLECERRGFTPLLYAEAIGRLSEGKRTLAIGGTHGKTTTTGLTIAAARGAGLDPSHIVGGEVPELGGNGYGGHDDVLIVEACEFNRSFHNLKPHAAAILNLDHDHFDCYPSTDDLHDAFAGYVNNVRRGGAVLIEESVPANIVDEVCTTVRVLRVGSGLFADIRAVGLTDLEQPGCFEFTPVLEGRELPRVRLSLPGRFQVQNALFALGLVEAAGGDLEGACEGLASFAGVRRRFEMHEIDDRVGLVNDYAHHPAEIKAVLRAARRRFPGRPLLVAFQPHQHRRTLHLFDEFVEALAEADKLLICPIYGARESEEVRKTVSHLTLIEALRERGARAEDAGPVEGLAQRVLAMRKAQDLVLVLGAGDIDDAVTDIVDRARGGIGVAS
ncbi:MAG: UDP-N-acetylmuramate--L-alanine ligase [Planctomycetota bacterium]